MPHVGLHIDQEFDVPVSVAVVSHDGRAMVDCDCVPALAFNPSYIPAHARRSIQCLNEEAKFNNGDKEFASFFPRSAFRMLTKIMVPGNAYLLGQPKGRQIERVTSFEYKKKQLMEISSIHPAFTQTAVNSMLHFEGARGARPCHCAAYLAMHPTSKVVMVVWEYSDIRLLGGVPTDEMIIPYLLSVDMAVLYMMKFGFEPPVTKKMSELSRVNCTLEEAFIKIIGVAPSAQPAIQKKSTSAIGRPRMLQELYQITQAFRSKYPTAFRETLLSIKPEAMHKLALIHRDPVTWTVRPSLGEKDPYSSLTEVKYNRFIEDMTQQRAPRFVHECCKLMNHSKDVPHSSIFSLFAIKDLKIAAEQRMSNQRQALVDELTLDST